jgi:hypothetical protein
MLCSYCVRSALLRLEENDSKLNVKSAQKLLAAVWNAKEVEFVDVHGRTLLENALRQPLKLKIVFEVECGPNGRSATQDEHVLSHEGEQQHEDPPATQSVGGSQDAPSRLDSGGVVDPLHERFIRELDNAEKQRHFVWAGYVVREMLPTIGLSEEEANPFLQRLVREGVVLISKRPNPKNPDFPTSCVTLNRENAIVKRLIENGRSSVSGQSVRGSRLSGFRPIKATGGPVSKDIIRARR